MAELGYTASEFYHSTPIEIDSALEYKDKKREYDTYTNVRPIAEAIRTHAIISFNTAVEKKSQIKDPKKLILFPWETEEITKKKEMTTDEIVATMKLMAATFGTKEKK